jgi:hypothetical protein
MQNTDSYLIGHGGPSNFRITLFNERLICVVNVGVLQYSKSLCYEMDYAKDASDGTRTHEYEYNAT